MDIGLEGAPITQGIAIVTLISSLLTDPAVVSLNARALVNGQLWRILTYAFPFGNSSQLIIGTILLYNLRIFERFMGSRKYGAFLVLSASVSTLSTIGIMSLFNSVDIEIYPASGPFFLIYSLLPLFYRFIPRLHSSKYIILGLTFSEKSWIYLLAGQLALSNGISTLVPALSGLLAGLLYGMDGLGLQQFRLPAFVNQGFAAVGSFFGSLFPAGPAPAQQQQRRQQAPPADRGTRVQRNYEDEFPPFAPTAPSEEAIATLMGLGFERAAVITALQRTNNNIDAAADWLISR